MGKTTASQCSLPGQSSTEVPQPCLRQATPKGEDTSRFTPLIKYSVSWNKEYLKIQKLYAEMHFGLSDCDEV